MKSLSWTPLLLLLACDVSRPYGAFASPTDPDADIEDDDDAGQDEDEPGSETGVKIPRRDASVATNGGRVDAGDGIDETAAPKPPPEGSPLEAYAGTYLLRMDMFSGLESSIAGVTLSVDNRVSNLMLAEVGVDGDQLVARETFCHQVYEHNCKSGCVDGWKTTPDANLAQFFPHANATRIYRVEDTTLVAEESIMALGFDDPNVTDSTKLPDSVSDARLWKLSDGDAARVGLRTRLQAKVRVLGLVTEFDCSVAAVQLFASKFEGELGDPASPLEDVRFKLDTPPMPAASLDASGKPASYCSTSTLTEQGQSAKPRFGDQYVRFRKTDSSDACPPVSVFDEQLPPDPP